MFEFIQHFAHWECLGLRSGVIARAHMSVSLPPTHLHRPTFSGMWFVTEVVPKTRRLEDLKTEDQRGRRQRKEERNRTQSQWASYNVYVYKYIYVEETTKMVCNNIESQCPRIYFECNRKRKVCVEQSFNLLRDQRQIIHGVASFIIHLSWELR